MYIVVTWHVLKRGAIWTTWRYQKKHWSSPQPCLPKFLRRAGTKHSCIPKKFPLPYLLTGIETLLIGSVLQIQPIKSSYSPVRYNMLKYNQLDVFFWFISWNQHYYHYYNLCIYSWQNCKIIVKYNSNSIQLIKVKYPVRKNPSMGLY